MRLSHRRISEIFKVLGGLVFALLVVGLSMQTMAKEKIVAPATRKVAGDLFCTGKTQYRIGNGPLLTGDAGHLPVSLPIQVTTQEYNCRLLLPGCGLFELGPRSAMHLDRTPDGQLQMRMDQGSVAYSLPDGMRLKVSEPGGREARAGQAAAASAKKGFAHTGIARVIPGKFFEVSNLAGKLAVADKDGVPQEVFFSNPYRAGRADQSASPVWRASAGIGVSAPTVSSTQMAAGVAEYCDSEHESSSPSSGNGGGSGGNGGGNGNNGGGNGGSGGGNGNNGGGNGGSGGGNGNNGGGNGGSGGGNGNNGGGNKGH